MIPFAAALFLTLAAAPTPRLASPPWQSVNVDQKQVTFFADYFAQQLAQAGIRVTTSTEMAQIVGLERQKQLLGCSGDSPSCLAELAGALGVDGIITGSIARTGKYYVVTIKIIQASDASQLALGSTKAKNDDALVDWLSDNAPKMADSVRKNLKPAAPPVEVKPPPVAEKPPATEKPAAPAEAVAKVEPEKSSGGFPAWIPIAGGVAALGTGAVFDVLAHNTASSIANTRYRTESALTQDIQKGQTQETVGFVLMGVGVAAVATGVVLYALPHGEGDQTAMNVTFSGKGVALSGTFP